MPEYVYALHDFLPENEDEVDFRAGERIEVVEKDDLYGDGWWQGRNLAGKVSLFPQSYTTAAAPEDTTTSSGGPEEEAVTNAPGPGTGTILQPLAEESETDSPMTKPAEIVSTHSIGQQSLVVNSYPGTPIYAQTTGGVSSLPSPAGGYTMVNGGGGVSAPATGTGGAGIAGMGGGATHSYGGSFEGAMQQANPRIDGLPPVKDDSVDARGGRRPSHLTLSSSEGNLKNKA